MNLGLNILRCAYRVASTLPTLTVSTSPNRVQRWKRRNPSTTVLGAVSSC